MAEYVWFPPLSYGWNFLLLIECNHKVPSLLRVWGNKAKGDSKLNDSPYMTLFGHFTEMGIWPTEKSKWLMHGLEGWGQSCLGWYWTFKFTNSEEKWGELLKKYLFWCGIHVVSFAFIQVTCFLNRFYSEAWTRSTQPWESLHQQTKPT